jgi:XTP/dITP diphosphohydrolase
MPEISLLIATRNAHKTGEIRAILGNRFRFLTLNDFPGAPKVVEDAATFAGNASKKAVELARWLSASRHSSHVTGHAFVLADDSGLEVDALNGAPGVHSARFAALDSAKSGNTPDADNNAKLLSLLKDVPLEKRTARFHCVIALTPVPPEKAEAASDVPERREGSSPVCYADEFEMETEVFDGVCEGRIILEPRGRNGFGYDPLFVPVGYEQTFAELDDTTKNQLSHRSKALQKLLDRLRCVN